MSPFPYFLLVRGLADGAWDVVIETANLLIDNLRWCLDEQTTDERVLEWKDEVYLGGYQVLEALEALLERYR